MVRARASPPPITTNFFELASQDSALSDCDQDQDDRNRVTIIQEPLPLPSSSSQVLSVAVRSALCGCANISTATGRRHVGFLILLIAVVPVLCLVVQNAFEVKENLRSVSKSLRVKQDVLFSTESGRVIHSLQIERGTSALYISSRGADGASGLVLLERKRKVTDQTIVTISNWIWLHYSAQHNAEQQNSGARLLRNRNLFHEHIRAFRDRVTSANVTVSMNMEFYSAKIETLIQWLVESIRECSSGEVSPNLVGYHLLVIAKERTGMERALGSTFFAQGQFSHTQLFEYLEKKLLAKTYLRRFQEYTQHPTLLDLDYQGSSLQETIQRMRSVIQSNVTESPDVKMAQWWFDNMTLYIDILKEVQEQLTRNIVAALDAEIERKEFHLLVSVSIMAGAVVLLFIVSISILRLTKRLQTFAVTLQLKTKALNHERRKSEHLLNQLLPVTVTRKLMANLPVEPESFRAVTIFFSDIVGFTNISSRSSPLQVIEMLNRLYKAFDEITDSYCVYKVETIGDAYMIASGLPVKNEDGHAREMGELAVEVRDTVCNMAVPHLPQQLIQIRIGLNSGSVACGIVGYKMPRYCLFGDTVNVASRMESTGVPAKIQISGSTFRELKRFEGFVMEERGMVEIKGKGPMLTYFLINKSPCCFRRMPRSSRL